jgi:hypothetical protein
MFMFPSMNSPLRNSFLSTDMNQFNFGVIDTSEMTLPVVNPPSFTSPRSLQEEEASLQQIDSFLLSGVCVDFSYHYTEYDYGILANA